MTREQIMAAIMEYAKEWGDGETHGIDFVVERMQAGCRLDYTGDIRAALVRLLRRGELELTDEFRLRLPIEEAPK